MTKSATGLSLQFLGAAETVTGSKYLLRANGNIYLIDCGLFQGLKKLRLLNRAPLPFDAKELEAVLLTHAHLDHVGYLPVLVKQGFTGPVYCTHPTADLAAIILRNSAMLQQEEAGLANEEGYSRHQPALPLYTEADVEQTLKLLHPVKTDTWTEAGPELRFRLRLSGHVLGAAYIEADAAGKRIVFSGDIGRRHDLLLPEPTRPTRADVLVMESTYGGRLHPQQDMAMQLARIISQTVESGGTVIIPSFALQRAQMLMYLLWQMRQRGLLPKVPLFMDSPMGADVMQVFGQYPEWLLPTARELHQMLQAVVMVSSFKLSRGVVTNPKPKVVIASSGMITGGRVLSYLEEYLEQQNCCVVLAGYQAEGTRGRQLQQGATEIKIRGRYYQVRARIEQLDGLSSHADQQGLLDWVALLQEPPEQVFLTHGEQQASDALRVKLLDKRGWNATVPAYMQEYDLLK